MIKIEGDGYYTEESEYVVGRVNGNWRVTRGDGDCCECSGEGNAHDVARSLASGETEDSDYIWIAD